MAQVGIRERALAIARTWIGTPYKHQASLKGAGCDCIGLIVGVWYELYGMKPKNFKMPVYTPYWAEETGEPLMTDISSKYLEAIPVGEEQPGDILMWQMRHNSPTKHAGICSKPGFLIHAYAKHNILETAYIKDKGAVLTHVFKYPERPYMGE